MDTRPSRLHCRLPCHPSGVHLYTITTGAIATAVATVVAAAAAITTSTLHHRRRRIIPHLLHRTTLLKQLRTSNLHLQPTQDLHLPSIRNLHLHHLLHTILLHHLLLNMLNLAAPPIKIFVPINSQWRSIHTWVDKCVSVATNVVSIMVTSLLLLMEEEEDLDIVYHLNMEEVTRLP